MTELQEIALENLSLAAQAEEHYNRAKKLEQQVLAMQVDLDFLQEWRDAWLGIRNEWKNDVIRECIHTLYTRVLGDNTREEQEVLRCIHDLKQLQEGTK